MKASPFAQVKERFKDKAGLVAAVQELATDELWISRVSEDKGWSCISNTKLLHLHAVLSSVKSEFGSRGRLIDAILEIERRIKDEGYKLRLERLSTPRLMDELQAARKRSKSASKAEAKKAERTPAKAPAEKAPAKKAAAKKAAAKKAS